VSLALNNMCPFLSHTVSARTTYIVDVAYEEQQGQQKSPFFFRFAGSLKRWPWRGVEPAGVRQTPMFSSWGLRRLPIVALGLLKMFECLPSCVLLWIAFLSLVETTEIFGRQTRITSCPSLLSAA